MLEQTPIEEETTTVPSVAPLQTRTSSCLQSNAPIAGKGANVGRGVAPNWRADLESRIEIYQASGLSRNEATAAALHEMREAELAQYGAGRTGAGTLKQGRLVRLRKRLRSLSLSPPLFAEARAATVVALILFGLPSFDALALPLVSGQQSFLLRWWLHCYHLKLDVVLNMSQPAVDACIRSYGRFELLAVPLLAGLLSGLLARKNATRGVWNALALLAIPMILLPGIDGALHYAMDDQAFISGGEMGVFGIGYWAMLGIGGARIGQWLREKRAAQRSRLASEVSPISKAGMERAHRRRCFVTPPLFPNAVAATLTALPLFGLAWWADNSTNAFTLWQQLFQEDRWKLLSSAVFQMVRSSEDAGFYRFELFVIPSLIGLLTGLLTRRNAARGVLNALGLLAIPALLLPGIAAASQFAGLIPEHISLNWQPNIRPAVNGIAIWGLLGAGSAHAVQWLKRKVTAIWNRNN